MQKNLPKISLITPSYNQGKFIEKTIDSVLSQNYPALEYIVIDGGSTDETVKILKKYSEYIWWISEKDKGQSQALNKGLKKVTGEVIGYLNSDDYLEKGALLKIGSYFAKTKKAHWVTGKCRIVDEKGKEVRRLATFYKNYLLKFFPSRTLFFIIQFISQPSTFWRREVTESVGYFDEKLQYDMDYDYWLRIWSRFKLHFIDDYLSSYRVHRSSKAVTSPETQFEVAYEIVSRYTTSKIILFLHKFHSKILLLIYRLFWIK